MMVIIIRAKKETGAAACFLPKKTDHAQERHFLCQKKTPEAKRNQHSGTRTPQTQCPSDDGMIPATGKKRMGEQTSV